MSKEIEAFNRCFNWLYDKKGEAVRGFETQNKEDLELVKKHKGLIELLREMYQWRKN